MTAPLRHRLPNRRTGIAETIQWDGGEYDCQASFDPAAPRVSEAFISGHKVGSAMAATMADAAIMFSILLQAGFPADYLAQRLSRGENDQPTSPIGAMADFAARVDIEIMGKVT